MPPGALKLILWFQAGVAQSVEQLTRNEKVGGSIPLSGINKETTIRLDA